MAIIIVTITIIMTIMAIIMIIIVITITINTIAIITTIITIISTITIIVITTIISSTVSTIIIMTRNRCLTEGWFGTLYAGGLWPSQVPWGHFLEQSQVGNAEEVYSDVEFVWMGHSHPLSVYWSRGGGNVCYSNTDGGFEAEE